jgi:superfamily I DNA and/or RNA helicase
MILIKYSSSIRSHDEYFEFISAVNWENWVVSV